MKKPVILLLSIFFILFLACSNDSDDEQSTDDGNAGNPPVNPITEFPGNFQGTGDSANDLLSNTIFDSMRVEIAFVQNQSNFRPTDIALQELQEYLEQFTFKENIEYVFTPLESPDEEDLELQEIADLELENRTVYSEGTTLGVYIYFADAPSEGDDLDEGLVTLGAVYRNTSMVIFEQTVRTLAGRTNGAISITDVESATLNHEFGHLLGLVNLGTPNINDHEDTTTDEDGNEVGNNHCNVDPCLMRAQLEFRDPNAARSIAGKSTGLQSSCTLTGLRLIEQMELNTARGLPAVPELDAECQLDLESNGGRPNIDS